MNLLKMFKLSSYAAVALLSCGHQLPHAMADEPQTGPGFVVNVASDNNDSCTTNDCSLREAMTAATAQSGATITFNITGDGPHTIELLSELPDLTDGVNLDNTGAGAEVVVIARAATAATDFGILNQADNATSSISGLTLREGNGGDGGAIDMGNSSNLTITDCTFDSNSGGGSGGAIFSVGASTTVQRCTFLNNTAARGGAIFHSGGTLVVEDSTFYQNNSSGANGGAVHNEGIATFTNCTFSANNAPGGGGGALFNQSLTTLTLNHCTLTLNTANSSGGGIASQVEGNLNLNHTIIAGNTAFFGPDLSGTMTGGDYNLIGDPTEATLTGTHNLIGFDPQLGTLANNGGPTLTHAPTATSPVINAGNPTFNATDLFDQRGPDFARKSGSSTDIGAVELQGDPDAYPQAKTQAFDVPSGQTYSGTLYGSDADGDALTFAITAQPQHGTLTLNNAATGAFTFAADNVLSPDSFTYSVTANGLTTTATVSIRITETPSLIVTSTSSVENPYDNIATLPDAITYANSGQAGANPVITFDLPDAGPHTITLSESLPLISHNMSILNEGASAERVTIDGGHENGSGGGLPTMDGIQVFLVDRGRTFTASGLTLTRAVSVLGNQGTATIRGCTIVDNGDSFPSITNEGELTIVNTTLVDNFSMFMGAITNFRGTMTFINSTLSDNSGISNNSESGSDLRFLNSIVSSGMIISSINNGGMNARGSGISGPYQSDHSLIGDPSALDPAGLANNGGLVDTIALRQDGPAINTGDDAHIPAGVTTDARGFGFPRIVAQVDIGAYEARLQRISGYIRTNTLAPIPNVSVQLNGTIGTGGPVVTTDANGFYMFVGVPSGNYTVTPTKTNWTFSPSAQSLTVGSTDRGANFIGTRTVATYSISGRIANSSGGAITGVSVALTPTRGGVFNPVTTNSAGYYTFSGIPDGDYTLTPTLNGTTFSPATRTVKVEGANQSGLNFIGMSGHKIIGRVMTASGVGIAGVTVTRSGAGSTPVTTNSAGYYTLINVPNGNIRVTPSKSGYVFTPTDKLVVMNSADVTGQNFIGATGYSITGRIAASNGAAISGVDVQLDNGPVVQTNSAGYYTFHNVTNGSHTIVPSKSGYNFTPAQRTVNVGNGDLSGQNFTGTGP